MQGSLLGRYFCLLTICEAEMDMGLVADNITLDLDIVTSILYLWKVFKENMLAVLIRRSDGWGNIALLSLFALTTIKNAVSYAPSRYEIQMYRRRIRTSTTEAQVNKTTNSQLSPNA